MACCGYKSDVLNEYFANYFLHDSDVTFDFKNNISEIHSSTSGPWRVTLVDTGEETMTGGRLLRTRKFLDEEGTFFLTYGDGVDIDGDATVWEHEPMTRLAAEDQLSVYSHEGIWQPVDTVRTSSNCSPCGSQGACHGGRERSQRRPGGLAHARQRHATSALT